MESGTGSTMENVVHVCERVYVIIDGRALEESHGKERPSSRWFMCDKIHHTKGKK